MKIVSQNKHRCNYILPRWSFNSKPTLLCLQLYSEVIGNFVRCLLLSKLKLGLELKRKYSPKSQILNNSYPTFLERLNIYFFPDRGIREFVVAGLTVCGVLVLTHNFLIRKQVITRLQMKMFVGCVNLEGK